MKIEYFITPFRVIQCQVHLRETMNVESVLNECVWLPPVLRVHIETRKCCREPEFALDGSSNLTDSRLARFVAVEGSVFQTTCYACGAVKNEESKDISLLHWRSLTEVRYWKSMPWFAQVMEHSTCTQSNGQEILCSSVNVADITNQAPSPLLLLPRTAPEETFLHMFESIIPLIRRCVHPRLLSYMRWFCRQGKVYVAFRQKRKDGYYFQVKEKAQCLAWPRELITVDDGFPVVAAARCAEGSMGLEQFMQCVVQLIHVAALEFMLVVNWPESLEKLPGHTWCYETKTKSVHGMSVKYPLFHLALGTTKFGTFFHGTTVSAGDHILANGFESNAFHSCPGSYYKCIPPYVCACKGMLGPGVYLASFDKASANAGRVSGPRETGMVLECQVLVGECKFVTPFSLEYCKCGCESLCSDHVATWYHEQLFDCIFLCSGAGVKREELCVRRPKRISPLEQWFVKYNDRRERTYAGKTRR